MIPLVDMHCHLLAGLDDGPRTDDDALAMCRMAYEEGTRLILATAHQSETWPEVTPERIRLATLRLERQLAEAQIELSVFACAEVMVQPGIEDALAVGRLLTVADGGRYLLVEMPHKLYVNLRGMIERLCAAGVRPILAHPERCPELLHESGEIESLIRAGCLVQVSTHSITEPPNGKDERDLKNWFQRRIVHVLGSDGHSPRRRPPRIRAAYERVTRWAGADVANQVASANGTAILRGLPLRVPQPQPPRRRALSWFRRTRDN
jgi:protein-tyrosine phosphatase